MGGDFVKPRCYCLCKDTNSQASHNHNSVVEDGAGVVIAYAKILILKQVTTQHNPRRGGLRCYCLCKDTNSQASHNPWRRGRHASWVVIAYAKILILKQVTTAKYKDEINLGCYCLCKDTNSQASHNRFRQCRMGGGVVIAYAKILILKQVTTRNIERVDIGSLLLPMQRY